MFKVRGDSFDDPQESKKIPDNGYKWHKTRFWRRFRADPDIKEKYLKRSPTLPYQNLTINAYFRMINGNRGCSYNIGMWNCRKGLVDGENKATYKMVEAKKFIKEDNLHLVWWNLACMAQHQEYEEGIRSLKFCVQH